MRRQPKTLAEQLVREIGFRKTVRVMAFVSAWGICTEALGRPPASIEEYAGWWTEGFSTACRERAMFREAFPGESTPERMWERVKAHRAELAESKREAREFVTAALMGMPPVKL
jgi:hypothetical protein